MQIYSITNSKLLEISEKQFKLEREIQELFEANLNEVMGLTLIKSDFRYSNTIVYNNFIWNVGSSAEIIATLTSAEQGILDARNLFPNASLADLYDKVTMPNELVKAHQANNKAVDEAYGYKGEDDDASRVAFLFKKYEEFTSILPSATVKKKRIKKNDAQSDLI
jgi:hypothetical protein